MVSKKLIEYYVALSKWQLLFFRLRRKILAGWRDSLMWDIFELPERGPTLA